MGQNQSALLHAASEGDVEAIRAFVNQRADVNAKDQDGQWTALHYAAWGGHSQAARELLASGAAVNARDAELKTPLHYAVLGGHTSTAQALCEHGAAVNAADHDGQTPLHKAAVQGQLALVQELIARGADPNARYQDGTTSCHLASWKGHAAVLEYLLRSGADANASNLGGETPLHDAAKEGHDDCCRLLMQHGASTAKLDAESRTPADLAHLHNFVRTAALVQPSAREVEAQQLQEPSAAPSAPAWQPADDGSRISYPVIDLAASRAEPLRQASEVAGTRYGLPEDDDDWASQQEDDWEGVSPPSARLSRGSQLMSSYAEGRPPQERRQGDPFWMVPGPIKWVAGGLGGMLASFNPWKPQQHQPDNQTQPNDAIPSTSVEAQQAALEAREAEVARLSQPRTGQQLSEEQLAKLKKQEAEIARLRADLEALQGANASSASLSTKPESPSKAASSSRRHRIIDLPQEPVQSCREVSAEELREATGNFEASNRLGSNEAGAVYRGVLDGAPVAIFVPRHGGTVPWHALKTAADRLVGLRSEQLVPIRAVCLDGSTVFDLMQNGSVEDALRSRGPMAGQPPVRLDWASRAEAALRAAQGLLDLHRASPSLLHLSVNPANLLLSASLDARLAPPSLPSIANSMPDEPSTSHNAPEIRRGEAGRVPSDVFSLGILFMQLLTGSEAQGLMQHMQQAVGQGRLASVLDPCADGITAHTALPLAKLALRCTEFHAEDRPDLEEEVIPALFRIVEEAKAGHSVTEPEEEEPPAHLVCPITQEVMKKPVILSDGFTYEESAIKQWLDSGKKVSPMTNAPLQHCNMTPNFVIRSAASTWLEKHPEYGKDASKPTHRRTSSALQKEVENLNQILRQQAMQTGGDQSVSQGPSTPHSSRHMPAELGREAADSAGQFPTVPTTIVPPGGRRDTVTGRAMEALPS